MPNDIIANWLNLSSVNFEGAETNLDETSIFLSRKFELGFTCSVCGRKTFSTWGSNRVKIRDLSVFEYSTFLILDKYRVNCPFCGIKIEHLGFVEPRARCTIRFEEFVAKLCRITNIKAVAQLLAIDWKTVKAIDKKYLRKEFGTADYADLRLIAVDEISSHKGHQYFTVVLNLEKTKVVWVGRGRKEETLDKFFKELGPERCKKLEAIATDMWDPYLASAAEYAPQAKVVFDKFHVIKNYSRVVDKVRNIEYKKANESEREVIKGSKYLLLKNSVNLKDDEKERLENLLTLNKNISLTYILKDELKRLWDFRDTENAEIFLNSWIQRARLSGIRPLREFAKTLHNYRWGLINHCEYPIDTGKLEGMNNKIKVIKRIAYGFHDDEYFIMKIKQACSSRYTLQTFMGLFKPKTT